MQVITTSFNTSSPDQHGTCVSGGHLDMVIPDEQPAGFLSDFVGVAGNDTHLGPMVACCGNYPVNYAPPCTLWCATDGTTTLADVRRCWTGQGFEPEAILRVGSTGMRQEIWLSQEQTTGIVVGAVLVLAVAVGTVTWFCCRRRRANSSPRKTHGVDAMIEKCRSVEEATVLQPSPYMGAACGADSEKVKQYNGYEQVVLGKC